MMKFKLTIKAFGYTFDKEWGDPSKVNEIIKGAVTILTVGIDFALYV